MLIEAGKLILVPYVYNPGKWVRLIDKTNDGKVSCYDHF